MIAMVLLGCNESPPAYEVVSKGEHGNDWTIMVPRDHGRGGALLGVLQEAFEDARSEVDNRALIRVHAFVSRCGPTGRPGKSMEYAVGDVVKPAFDDHATYRVHPDTDDLPSDDEYCTAREFEDAWQTDQLVADSLAGRDIEHYHADALLAVSAARGVSPGKVKAIALKVESHSNGHWESWNPPDHGLNDYPESDYGSDGRLVATQ